MGNQLRTELQIYLQYRLLTQKGDCSNLQRQVIVSCWWIALNVLAIKGQSDGPNNSFCGLAGLKVIELSPDHLSVSQNRLLGGHERESNIFQALKVEFWL